MTFHIVLATRKDSLAANGLKAIMWSPWSHSAVLDDELGRVWDTTFTHKGCKSWDWDDWIQDYPGHDKRTLQVPLERYTAARAWLKSQEGTAYDWRALIGLLVHHDMACEAASFCSRFSETFRNEFEVRRFRVSPALITPRHQDLIV